MTKEQHLAEWGLLRLVPVPSIAGDCGLVVAKYFEDHSRGRLSLVSAQ